MLYNVVLSMHLFGAAITALFAAYAFVRLWQRREDTYSFCAKALGIIAGFEIGTGVALSMLSPLISALSLCANIAVYLSIVLAVEALLFVRMRNSSVAFPLRSASSPILVGLISIVGAVSHGF